jgi:succinyl-CoA synthetase beta subunit
MYIHEYQAKAVLARRGIAVPAGRVATSPLDAAAAFDELHTPRAVIKAQVHAGGRGKAGGIVPVAGRTEAEAAARRLLGSVLVTPQTGPRGRPVQKVLVQEWLEFRQELYLGVTLDRERGVPRVLASARGGMEIEELGRTAPDAIITEFGCPVGGIEPFQARKIFAGLGLPHELMKPATQTVMAAARAFIELDASLIEINPLAMTADGRLVAADAKMSFDDSALARHPEIADLGDASQEDPREVEAARYDLSHVGLGGNVGCMVNGGGLAMATMDLLRMRGGEPANFLDLGGAATAEKVAAAFRLICQDDGVRSILVSIFGGIVRCDLVAEGILQAVRQVNVRVPLVVRLEGNFAKEGRRALAASGLSITSADSPDDAARRAVELAALPEK